MQVSKQWLARPWRRWGWIVPAAALLVWQRQLVWQAAVQLFLGMLVALAALPMMRLVEKKLSPDLAASAAMASLSLGLIGLVALFLPPLIDQGRQIVDMTPELYNRGSEAVQRVQDWLAQNGIEMDAKLRNSLLSGGESLLKGAAKGLADWARGAASGLGRWMLAPVFAFYFLRDRKRIGDWLLMLLPADGREITVKILREMKRETAGYLRGQLMISAVVGGLTAAGLLLCGVPTWLLLGAAMGVLELIPYIGPFIGGVLVFLFSWQGGLSRLLWAMGVVLVVQQAEGGMLSPQLMSDATRLHPVAVLLCVMLGGAAAGVAGILLSVPLALCVRATLRVVSLRRSEALYRPPER